MGMLSGAEADVLVAHGEGMMMAFVEELARHGGPTIDADELMLRFRLSSATGLLGMIQFIEQDIYPEVSRAEFATIKDRWDPRIQGKWNARCRAIAIICQLELYEKSDLYGTFMNWAKKHGLTAGKYGWPPAASRAVRSCTRNHSGTSTRGVLRSNPHSVGGERRMTQGRMR